MKQINVKHPHRIYKIVGHCMEHGENNGDDSDNGSTQFSTLNLFTQFQHFTDGGNKFNWITYRRITFYG